MTVSRLFVAAQTNTCVYLSATTLPPDVMSVHITHSVPIKSDRLNFFIPYRSRPNCYTHIEADDFGTECCTMYEHNILISNHVIYQGVRGKLFITSKMP